MLPNKLCEEWTPPPRQHYLYRPAECIFQLPGDTRALGGHKTRVCVCVCVCVDSCCIPHSYHVTAHSLTNESWEGEQRGNCICICVCLCVCVCVCVCGSVYSAIWIFVKENKEKSAWITSYMVVKEFTNNESFFLVLKVCCFFPYGNASLGFPLVKTLNI